MIVFVYEYTCAGGLAAHPLSGALQVEGWAMLSALLEDFGQVPEIETVALLEERCGHSFGGGACRRIAAAKEENTFRELARKADYTLIIAPEFDGILQTRCQWTREVGGRLLGSLPSALELTADKWALSQHLLDSKVPAPASRLYRKDEAISADLFPVVYKPRYGAGSQATFLVKHPDELPAIVDQARTEGWEGEALLQPFVPGQPASVAFLMGPKARLPLLPAAQDLSQDGRFHYLGGTLPLSPELARRVVRLAKRALDTIGGLRGYVGVDVVLGDARDGSQDWVIEMNPRLTTSYVGLRALAETNLAEALLRVAVGDDNPCLLWRPGMAQFQADGQVTVCQ